LDFKKRGIDSSNRAMAVNEHPAFEKKLMGE
jgi:hypothetical protein